MTRGQADIPGHCSPARPFVHAKEPYDGFEDQDEEVSYQTPPL